ncbi:hypothetical protein MJO28_003555 [Puccinia striiformis f. sp. tritici]|uniref:Uncharacterized protein n=1 Tax=Puccinia striiformis f. sp. tritici TaxID=168172 RepID=A0ACC0ELY9_9BASI|nr:hypothetical protein MJO28_003555 [Puccinia striiformis f. sp. tritici]
MVNSPGRQRRRPIRSNTIIVRVSTVHASRRSRNAAARSNRRREAAEQADIDEAIQLGRRLGIILPQTATGIQAAPPSNTENRQEPLFGSYFDADIRDEWADSPIATHAEYFRLRRYAERRETIAQQWAELDNEATAAYLYNQQSTSNWTTPAANPSTNLSRCVCASKDISERRVDMIDIIHRHGGLLVKFCKCTPDVIRLIHYGYFACSADEPRTAFSIRLVQYHHFLWQASAVPASAFIESLSSFLDTRTTSPLFNRGSNHKRRELRVPFTLCIDLYNRILNKSRKIYEDGLRFTSIDKWASKCPRCFGPILNEVRNPGEATVHLSMDGNFQQRHYAHSSKDCPVEDQYPELFLRPSKITTDIEQLAATDAVATGINPPCSETHKAANDTRDGSTWDKCDDNGLFASTCRHDVPLIIANIHKTGEKLYYPLSIIRNFLVDFPDYKVGVLYDIGCHLEAHIKKRNLLSDRIADLQFGTSVFHAYVHEWSCQVKYNPRFNDGWGLTDGEGLERFWLFLSPLVSTLCVSTRLHRLTSIQSRAEYYSAKLTSSTADWLSKKSSDCTKTIKSSASILRQLHALPNPTTPGTNYTNTFFERQWDLERNYHLNINQTREKARQELGHLLCLQEELDASLRRVATSTEQAISRAHACANIAIQIRNQRITIGAHALIDNLNSVQSDLLWKVWYSKINIRQQFLALAEERQPLRQACRIGEHTTLGTRASTRLMDSVRDRGRALHAAVDAYTARVLAFRAACPTRHAPPTMTYAELLRLQPDDPFWNDGLFTNGNKPWAIDANTQRGIRFLASLKRGEEEHRRLGWEVRRAMCWATSRHDAIWGTMRTMAEARHVNTTPLPQAVLPLVCHEALDSHSSMVHRVGCAGVVDVVHARLIELARLQVEWDGKIVEVFEQTPPQAGDVELLQAWELQISQITRAMRNGHLSGIPGDIHEQLLFPNGRPRSPSPEDHESDSDTHGNRHNSSDEAELVGHPDEGNDNIENRPEDDDDEDEDIEPLFQQLMDEVLLDNLTRATS